MPDFQVVEGKLSDKYNIFADHSFEKCEATDTRLMGVIAMRVTWSSLDASGDRLIQLFHLDYSEYGVDDYNEYIVRNDDPDTAHEVSDTWKRISGHLGGKANGIPFRMMIYMIDSALAINERHYRDHENDLLEFRDYVLLRLSLMRDATKDIFEKSIYLSPSECMDLVCPKSLSRFETINYFIMRMADNDTEAAAYLSTINADELKTSPLMKKGLLTVMRNRIARVKALETDNDISIYRCRTLFMKDPSYLFGQLLIGLSRSGFFAGSRDGENAVKKNPKVTSIEVFDIRPVSRFEAAIQLRQQEYITLFTVSGPVEDLDLDKAFLPSSSAMLPVPNGIMYANYNSDNSHVDTDNYYLNQDMYGAYLLSNEGELVVMSSKLMNITAMETDLFNSPLFSEIELKGRYKFDTQIFQTMCEINGAVFEDMIVKPEE